MVRGTITRYVAAGAIIAATLAMTLGLGAGAAGAAPKAKTPNVITITGSGVSDKISVKQADDNRLFSSLMDEVNWLATAKPQTTAPASSKLGPKYTVTVLTDTTANQVYDLYPLASGGPRAHRAAAQPGKKVADGWFYGRLTMPETLRASGAPLDAKTDVVAGGIGGIGGGVGEPVKVGDAADPASNGGFVNEIQRLFLLNGAVIIIIFFGLAGIAFLIRRKI